VAGQSPFHRHGVGGERRDGRPGFEQEGTEATEPETPLRYLCFLLFRNCAQEDKKSGNRVTMWLPDGGILGFLDAHAEFFPPTSVLSRLLYFDRTIHERQPLNRCGWRNPGFGRTRQPGRRGGRSFVKPCHGG
jgi:hypothetical protein